MKNIKYIGQKKSKSDTVAGTNTVWKKGQTLEIPDGPASVLVTYPSVWIDVKAEPIAIDDEVNDNTLKKLIGRRKC